MDYIVSNGSPSSVQVGMLLDFRESRTIDLESPGHSVTLNAQTPLGMHRIWKIERGIIYTELA